MPTSHQYVTDPERLSRKSWSDDSIQPLPDIAVRLEATDHVTRLQICKLIGQGAYGYVIEVCEDKENSSALKIVPCVQTTQRGHIFWASGRRENNFLQRYQDELPKCPYIVQPLKTWKETYDSRQEYLNWHKRLRKTLGMSKLDKATRSIKEGATDTDKIDVYYVQMKYYPQGSLEKWLDKNSDKSRTTYNLLILLFCDVLKGVKFLHDHKHFHRDLSPSNVLLDESRDGSRLCAVISDFGTVTQYGHRIQDRSHATYTRNLGNDLYSAPETKGTDYDQTCDLYSLGVITLKMFWGLRDNLKIFDVIFKLQTNGELENIPGLFQNDQDRVALLNMAKRQVSAERTKRMTADQMLMLPVLNRLSYDRTQQTDGPADHEMLKILINNNKILNQQLVSYTQQISDLQTKLKQQQTLRQIAEAKVAKVSNFEAANYRLQHDIERTEKLSEDAIKRLKKENNRLNELVIQCDSQVEALHRQLEEQKQQFLQDVNNSTTVNNALQNENSQLKKEIFKVWCLMQQDVEKIENLQASQDKLSNECHWAKVDLLNVQIEYDKLKTTHERTLQEFLKLQERANTTTNRDVRLLDLRRQIKEYSVREGALQDNLKILQDTNASLKNDTEQKYLHIRSLENAHVNLINELTQKERKIATLTFQLEEFHRSSTPENLPQIAQQEPKKLLAATQRANGCDNIVIKKYATVYPTKKTDT